MKPKSLLYGLSKKVDLPKLDAPKAIAIGFLFLPVLTSVTPTALANRNSKVCCRCNMNKSDYETFGYDEIDKRYVKKALRIKHKDPQKAKSLLEFALYYLEPCKHDRNAKKVYNRAVNELNNL